MSVFNIVRENLTARNVAEYYGLKVNRKGMACCPFHDDKTPSMKIDQRYYCFGCGEKGDAVDYVSKMFGLNPKDAAVKICVDFGVSFDEKYHSSPKKVKSKKSDEQIFKEAENHCYMVLCDYLHLLKSWKTKYAPKNENCEWHPRFCEALKEIDHVEYMLDLILDGDISDRAFFITNYGKKVKDIERRMEELKQETAKRSSKCIKGSAVR
ncbi:CHC2 zinc finger domain-containing protein [Ruminococcus sp.]|uniref:CHC2 zinc finger domain-containing protein n=1 Tax=Ruminococcus sp. TaxID=41978 RepID=UPI0025DC410B|nr:CHC2 zinc finger domain-containing protein [Ruminococcus sp.]